MRPPFVTIARLFLATMIAVFALAPGLAQEKGKGKGGRKAMEFPGQPVLSNAINHLVNAQSELETNTGSGSKAMEYAEKALQVFQNKLVGGGKGSALEIARRLTAQAVKDLERNQPADAARHIDQALKSARMAGETGARKKGL